MWIPLLFCALVVARYANAVPLEGVRVAAYGQVFCDAQKSETPSSGTVKLYESDSWSDDEAE
ncbi:hypothetical protein AAVH_40776 [Aphelenchoides avenae]|nr:hypothetical protein AAVH_40776 [Aphelenchus avenae]